MTSSLLNLASLFAGKSQLEKKWKSLEDLIQGGPNLHVNHLFDSPMPHLSMDNSVYVSCPSIIAFSGNFISMIHWLYFDLVELIQFHPKCLFTLAGCEQSRRRR